MASSLRIIPIVIYHLYNFIHAFELCFCDILLMHVVNIEESCVLSKLKAEAGVQFSLILEDVGISLSSSHINYLSVMLSIICGIFKYIHVVLDITN